MYGLLFILGAYLLGAVPFGLLIGLARGVDIRQHGSRNIGATNAGRVLGRKWGYLCLALDVLKGFIPTLAASFVFVTEPVDAGMLLQWILVGVAAVLGHTLPIYLKFRGGKGVATTVGVALGIFPYYTVAMGAAVLLYAVVRFSTGWVSAGSLTIAVAFPLAFLVYLGVDPNMSFSVFWPLAVVSVLLGLLIIVRHWSNIARLWRGEEMKLNSNNSRVTGSAAEKEM
ncbi:MAG: glycerol-3-phosphate 1-O-acyltransferase PlsY [Phycisphaerae bacterium]